MLPCKAGAKLSFRLVPNQDPKTIERLFREHVARVLPPGVTYEILTHHGAPAVLVNVDTPGVRAAVRAVKTGFGTEPVFIREGGSIPIVGLIKEHLGVDTLLLGWGQNDDNLHGPNEKFCDRRLPPWDQGQRPPVRRAGERVDRLSPLYEMVETDRVLGSRPAGTGSARGWPRSRVTPSGCSR